jgi:uncharacterized membrane protein
MKNSLGKTKFPIAAHIIFLPLYFPLLLLVVSGITRGGISWPVSSFATAIRYLPKLAPESNELGLSFSVGIGQAYAVSFVNYLIISLISAAASLLLLSQCNSSYFLYDTGAGALIHDETKKNNLRKNLVKRLINVIFIIAFILIGFYTPFRYVVPSEISPHRMLVGAYTIMVFLCSFLSILLTVLGITIFHLVRQILSARKSNNGN